MKFFVQLLAYFHWNSSFIGVFHLIVGIFLAFCLLLMVLSSFPPSTSDVFFCRVAWLVHRWSLLAGVCWNFQSCVSGRLSALNLARRSSASSIITTKTAASVVYTNSNTHDLAPIALVPLPNPSIANSTRR